jgi:hypothetical protein
MSDLSPHFFRRDSNGSVRVRMRFNAEEASLIEEAAGDTPLISYIHRVLIDRARIHAEQARKERQKKLEGN